MSFIPLTSSRFGLDCHEEESGLKFCYDLNYDKTYCRSINDYDHCIYNSNNLPVEGQKIIYWPNISIWPTEEINQTENLVLIYYLINPAGDVIRRIPIFIDSATIIKGKEITSPTAIAGIQVPSDYPGIWEIKTFLIKRDLYLENLNPGSFLDFKQEYNSSSFRTTRVHVLSYSENLTNELGVGTFVISLMLLAITIITFLKDIIINPQRERKKQIDSFKALYTELDVVSNKVKEGNLQWFLNSVDKGRPLHSIWKINVDPYMTLLPSNFNGKNITSLKKELVNINQKIEMINDVVLSGKYDLKKRLPKEKRYPDRQMAKFIKETIKETITKTEKIKEVIKEIISK